MVCLSYNKDQKSHRNEGSQTPVECPRAMRGHCDTNTSRAIDTCLHSSRGFFGSNMARSAKWLKEPLYQHLC